MEENNKILFIIIGAIIVGVFSAVSLVNMGGNNEYYMSTDIVKAIDYNNGKLTVTTRDDMISVCVKQTKTDPARDSLCWINTIDNKSITSIYEYKTYHIWTKDINGVISYYAKYNTNGNI